MAWETKREVAEDKTIEIRAWDAERPAAKFLVFKIDKARKRVTYYPKPKDNFFLQEIAFEGFTAIPPEVALTGYMPSGIQYYMNRQLKDKNVESLTIVRSKKSSFRKFPKRNSFAVVLAYSDFQNLRDGLTRIKTEATKEKSSFIDEAFHTIFPSKFTPPKSASSARSRAIRVVRNMDASIITELKQDEVNHVVDFVAHVLSKRYTASGPRLKLLKAAKVKVDEVALDDVLKQFKKLLKADVAESEWGKFLRTNLYLVGSEYIGILPELNVMLANARKVDFGLIDASGYLDLFEIKKSTTKILAAKTDRGNYYWHPEAVKAITQAEKYLYNAEKKADSLKSDLKRERKIDVDVVRPKAVLIMGNSEQFNGDESMRNDFRVLRQSLSNVEVVLYDELYRRLENQKRKVYTNPEFKLS